MTIAARSAGINAIRSFAEREFAGDHVTIDVREVTDHHGGIIVRAAYDGTHEKTGLPGELVRSSYFGTRDDKIISLTLIF